MKFTALYFGTFNPIHLGHIALGKYFAKQADIEAVWFVVTPQNPFKVNEALLDDGYRLEMVRLALENEPKLHASEVEFSLPIPHYTIHTLEHLDQVHPDKNFVLLMGEDNLVHFERWKQADRILEKVSLFVYPRAHPTPVPQHLLNHKKIQLFDAPQWDIASSAIRKIIRQGGTVEHLMPPASWAYLVKNGFYQ